jgi:hypothetical protein
VRSKRALAFVGTGVTCPLGYPSWGNLITDLAAAVRAAHGEQLQSNGQEMCQPFVDERADGEQREALLKIISGQDTEPMATMFAVFSSTLEKVYDPIFAKIDFNVDVEGRRGRYTIAGLIESAGEPIKNPVTGAETRARIDLPNGFEYEIAEIGSGTTKTHGNVQLDLKASYGQFAHLHLNNKGVVRHRTV